MSALARALCIAAAAHDGQADKAGAPYILHVLRVMLKMSTNEQRIAALLHDVVEDTSWTLEQLRDEGFSESIVQAIDCLTRRPGEDYDTFIERVATNKLSVRVKLADLEDNSSIDRLPCPTAADHVRVEKYRRALEFLRNLQSP